MAGAGPLVPSIPTTLKLLDAARAAGGPEAVVLELCILSLCLPWEAVNVELERIDWTTGYTEVPARGGRKRILMLPAEARKAILRTAGAAGGRGQAVTAGRGPRLQSRYVRLDRLHDKLIDKTPSVFDLPPWNFHGIRAAGIGALRKTGRVPSQIDAALGKFDRSIDRHEIVHVEGVASEVLETWNAILRAKRG